MTKTLFASAIRLLLAFFLFSDVLAAPPTVSSVAITTSPGNGTYYDAGETITFSVVFSELVNVTGTPVLNFTAAGASQTATYNSGTGTTTLTFDYTVPASGVNDGDGVDVTGIAGTVKNAGLEDADFSGATQTIATHIDTDVPTVNSITITSTDGNVSGGTRYLQAGDGVTVQVTLVANDTRANTTAATLSVGGNLVFSSTADAGTTNTYQKSTAGTFFNGTNGNLTVTAFTFNDFAGRTGNTAAVTFPVNPPIPFVIDTTLPVITFTDNVVAGPVTSDTINISVTDTNADTATYQYGFSADATCDATDTYGNAFVSGTGFTINAETNNGNWICARATDLAGNTAYAASANDLNIDVTAPTLTAVSIASNNADTTRARTNDTITITFTANEAIAGPTATILGRTATVLNTAGNTWTASLLTVGTEPEGVVAFSIDATDVAGNAMTAVTATTDASSVTYDRTNPMITSVEIVSNNAFGVDNVAGTQTHYAKTGEIATLTIVTNEAINIPQNATILGMPVTFANPSADDVTWIATYTFTGTDTEGIVSFSFQVADLAGNGLVTVTNTTTDTSRIIFDRTAPSAPSTLTVNDKDGVEQGQFKHRKSATYTWSNHNDNSTTGTTDVSTIYQFFTRFTHPSNGTSETATVNSSTTSWAPTIPVPEDDPYQLELKIRDKAGNETAWEVVYTQRYTNGLSGVVTDEKGQPISNVLIRVVPKYNDTCLYNVYICLYRTNADGEYFAVLQKDRDYIVTFYKPNYFLEKHAFHMPPVDDVEHDITLQEIPYDDVQQSFLETVRVQTTESFVDDEGNIHATELYASAHSGEITAKKIDDYIEINSFGRISKVSSNDPKVIAAGPYPDNSWRVYNAGNIEKILQLKPLGDYITRGISSGKSDNYNSGGSRIGVYEQTGNGMIGHRQAGQRRDTYMYNNGFRLTETESKAEIAQLNAGVRGEVLTYINANGYEIFRGYVAGKMNIKRLQNPEKFQQKLVARSNVTGSGNLENTGKNLAKIKAFIRVSKPHYGIYESGETKSFLIKKELQKSVQKKARKNYAPRGKGATEKRTMKHIKPRSADAAYAAKNRANYKKNKINKTERRIYNRREPVPSRIQKSQAPVYMMVGDKKVNLDAVFR